MMYFSIDGIPWDFGCSITRIAEMKASEISGMLLNKNYFNDVVGTYLTYNIKLEVPKGQEQNYNTLYEKITEPVGEHKFVVPYGDTHITITGRVANIQDIYRRTAGGGVRWHGISFSVISNNPVKKMTLDEIVASAGMAIPPDQTFEVGGIYLYTATGFEKIG